MDNISLDYGNISYIEDPNAVNINNDITNGIAQYQDMHISAELTAVRKGRSVLVKGFGLQNQDAMEVNLLVIIKTRIIQTI